VADDIVTRLRAGDHLACSDSMHWSATQCDKCDAADEIERLRNLLGEVNALHGTDEYENWCRHCEQMWPCPTVHLLRHKEARRG
jgi:hypothetical protein